MLKCYVCRTQKKSSPAKRLFVEELGEAALKSKISQAAIYVTVEAYSKAISRKPVLAGHFQNPIRNNDCKSQAC